LHSANSRANYLRHVKQLLGDKNMRNPFRFFIELSQQPIWIPIWVFFLMVINVASVVFWTEPLAKIIFAIFMISAMLMMALYSKYGFEKILGIGHVLWIPLALYLLTMLPVADATFNNYLIVLLISISISLAFDIVDVWKYFGSK